MFFLITDYSADTKSYPVTSGRAHLPMFPCRLSYKHVPVFRLSARPTVLLDSATGPRVLLRLEVWVWIEDPAAGIFNFFNFVFFFQHLKDICAWFVIIREHVPKILRAINSHIEIYWESECKAVIRWRWNPLLLIYSNLLNTNVGGFLIESLNCNPCGLSIMCQQRFLFLFLFFARFFVLERIRFLGTAYTN